MKARIAVLPGDGIGPEVTAAATGVLEAIVELGGHHFELASGAIGGVAIDEHGVPLPDETLTLCKDSDAVLLGAVGGPKWSDPAAAVRPEQGLLALRAGLGVFANLRPVRVHPALAAASPLKTALLDDVDILIVRELTGGIYFGRQQRDADKASDECVYTVDEIERIVRMAFELAQQRDGRLTSVDKANVLETSRLWRETATRIAGDYPDVSVEHLLVDAAAMHLLSRPADFDVIVTENMFGDILSDEASMLSGSLGLLPSASLSADGPGLYEPIHGSAPDIAGQGIANPLGAIASVAMLLRHSLRLDDEAEALERAIGAVVDDGVVTADLDRDGNAASTGEVTAAVIAAVRAQWQDQPGAAMSG